MLSALYSKSTQPTEEKKILPPITMSLFKQVRLDPDTRLAVSKLTYALPGLYSSNGGTTTLGKRKRDSPPRKQGVVHKDGQVWSNSAMAPPASRISPGLDNRPYTIIQQVDSSTPFITSSTTVPVFASSAFSLSQLDQVTSFTNLFDQYRIDEIECWLTPESSSSLTVSGEMLSVIDYDDNAVLPSFNAGLDYQNVVVSTSNIGHYRRFTPHIAAAAYSGTFTSYLNVTSPWIDCSSTGVFHYGLKAATQVAGAVVNTFLRIRFRVSFRNLR